MIQLVKGVELSTENNFSEGFQIMDNNWLICNAGAEKILPLMKSFVDYSQGLLLALFIEVPSNLKDLKLKEEATENEPGIIEEDTLDVYYLDDLDHETVKQLLDIFGEILVNDGLSHFGLINQHGEEIGKYRYNSIKAYSDGGEVKLMTKVFSDNSIEEKDSILTIAETITQDAPVVSVRYEDENGRTIYDVVETLKESTGMYFAERREY